MAYTIKFLNRAENKAGIVHNYLLARMAKEGKFRATLTSGFDNKGHQIIVVKPVRLINNKPYCGNHPGECPVSSKPKPRMSFLEWEDWVQFHGLVNRVLNRFRVNADVWSTPMDVRGKMWIRKGRQARLRYDWTEASDSSGFIARYWNQGTPDQFIKLVT